MRKAELVISALLLILLVAACAPAGAPAPKAPAAPAKAAWEVEWEKVQAAAKQEGTVVVLKSGGEAERDAMAQGMKALGIEAAVSVGSGPGFLPKIKAERAAGLYNNDIWVGGYTLIPLGVKAEGIVDYPNDSLLILPDVTDPATIKKVWYQGKLWWVDKDHSTLITTLGPRPPLAINTNLVKEGEIKSFRDILNPKWQGKIAQIDPTQAGGGQQVLQAMLGIMGENFVRELAGAKPTILRDKRLQLDWLAQGKITIAIAPDDETIQEFEKAGAPVKVVMPAEGVHVSAAASGIGLFNKAPHPNAAKVFVNWLTTKEGQTAFALAGRTQSLRLDVATAHLKPYQTRQEGVKYYDGWSEESQVIRIAETVQLAKELYEPLIKK